MTSFGTAYAAYATPTIPHYSAGRGISTPYGVLLPPGSRVAAYVRSGGPMNGDEQVKVESIVTTLAQGLQRVRAGAGDTVVVLPGHSESVADATMLDDLVSGTRVIGLGRGAAQPKFRWTATASKWQVKAGATDCSFENLHLQLEGTNGVVKAIEVLAPDTQVAGCRIQVASGASNKATIACEVGTAAHRFQAVGNYVYGTETHNVTDGFLLVGAAPASDVKFLFNTMIASATAANGLIRISVANKRIEIAHNTIYNTHTSSTACIAVANAASDGVIYYNNLGTMDDGTASARGIVFTSTGSLIKAFQNFSSDEPRASGILAPPAAT